MAVKFNGELSDSLTLIWGGHQGTLLGQLEYLVQSNDNADIVSPEDRFKYIDDLSVLQLILLSGLLMDYNFSEHIASAGWDNESPKFTLTRAKYLKKAASFHEANFIIPPWASDIGIDEQFLPPDSNPTQGNLDYVSDWTDENIMQLNEKKCNFMIFSRSES